MKRLAGVAAALLLSACAQPEVLVDFAAELPSAEVHRETGLVDLGTTEARPLLGAGWHWDETDGAGGTFVWSSGPSSELTVFVLEPRRLVLTLAGRPLAAPELPPQSVRVLLGGAEIGEFTVGPGESRWSMELPPSRLVSGENRIELVYGWSVTPASLGLSGDRRALAMAWDWIGLAPLGGPPASGEEVHVAPDGALVLPAGSRTDFFFVLPQDAAMEPGREVSEGGARLEVNLASDEGEHRLGGESWVTRVRLEVFAGPSGGGRVRLYGFSLLAGADRPPSLESSPAPPDASSARSSPPIFVFLVDTLRSDRLGPYGSTKGLTPNLDAFAAEAVTFVDSVAQASWTKASVASMFTGLWPPSHGAARADDALPISLPFLPELLGQAGYRRVAVVTNAYVGATFGFDRGFDRFELLRQHARSDDAVDRFGEILVEEAGSVPLFAYVHTVDPHAPYRPPSDLAERFAPEVSDPRVGALERVNDLVHARAVPGPTTARDLAALYDAEVAANDRQFGRFLEQLRASGLYDESVIVFLSDHGEAFDDHGTWSHGQTLFAEMVETPLIVRLPGGADGGLTVAETAQHADLLPTLLEYAGVAVPAGLDGESLARAIAAAASGDVSLRPRAVASHLDYFGKNGASLILGEWKLIEPLSAAFGGERALYHRKGDPGETRNLASERPVLAGYLASELRRRLASSKPPASERAAIDDDTRARLKALGYLE